MRAVSLWGAASAVGAAAGPLVGGLLVDSTGWQGLFWIDAAIAAVLHPRDASVDRGIARPEPAALDRLVRHRARGDDPCAVDPGGDEGIRVGLDLRTNRAVSAGLDRLGDRIRRRRAPFTGPARRSGAHAQQAADRRDARNPDRRRDHQWTDVRRQPVLPGPVGARHEPARGRSGDASSDDRARACRRRSCRNGQRSSGPRQVVALGFAITAAGFVVLMAVKSSWEYGAFVIPFLGAAVGMSMSNGPCSSVSTSAVPHRASRCRVGHLEHGPLRGCRRHDLGRRGRVRIRHRRPARVRARRPATRSQPEFSRVALVMAIVSALGIPLALLAGRHRPSKPDDVRLRGRDGCTCAHGAAPRPDPLRGMMHLGSG